MVKKCGLQFFENKEDAEAYARTCRGKVKKVRSRIYGAPSTVYVAPFYTMKVRRKKRR